MTYQLTTEQWKAYFLHGDYPIDQINEGLIVPSQTEARILRLLRDRSPMRQIAAQTPWALSEMGELYSMPAAHAGKFDSVLESAQTPDDIDQWIADEVVDVFAAQETSAFINGDGVNKPRGLLTYQSTPLALPVRRGHEDHVPWFLLRAIQGTRSPYRARACFIMNRQTLNFVSRLKDQEHGYIWQPPQRPRGPSTLLGRPVYQVDDMPDIGSGTFPIAYGDFSQGYQINDPEGVKVLRDPYSAKPYVLFYTTKKVGGRITDPAAITLLQIGD